MIAQLICLSARMVAIGLVFAAMIAVADPEAQRAERARNEDAALEMWPEAADPQSILGREMKRLLDHYTARGDPRLEQVTAPMWIASQAAANTERLRTDAESQQTAMRLYPDLAVLDSPLNRLFRETHARYREVKPEFLKDPRWPIKLAQQCAVQLEALRATGSFPTAGAATAEIAPSAEPSDFDDKPGSAAEVQPGNWRGWTLTLVLTLAGIALLIMIVRRALRIRARVPDEQDGSSI